MAVKRAKGTSKMAAVREALSVLGKKAKPVAIQEYLRTKGVEMTTGMVSNYKSLLTKKKRRKKRKVADAAPAVEEGAVRSKGITMADIIAVQELAAKMGPAKFRELAKVLV